MEGCTSLMKRTVSCTSFSTALGRSLLRRCRGIAVVYACSARTHMRSASCLVGRDTLPRERRHHSKWSWTQHILPHLRVISSTGAMMGDSEHGSLSRGMRCGAKDHRPSCCWISCFLQARAQQDKNLADINP